MIIRINEDCDCVMCNMRRNALVSYTLAYSVLGDSFGTIHLT